MKLWLETNINPIALHMQHTVYKEYFSLPSRQKYSNPKNSLFKAIYRTVKSSYIISSIDSYPFEMKSKERLKKLEKLYRKDAEELGPEYDSDDDFTDHNFVVGEKVDYL